MRATNWLEPRIDWAASVAVAHLYMLLMTLVIFYQVHIMAPDREKYALDVIESTHEDERKRKQQNT